MSDLNMVKGFLWDVTIRDPDGEVVSHSQDFNRIPAAGLAFLIRAPFGDVSPISTFYQGLFLGDYIPSDSTSAADIPSNMQEFIDYSELERPLWERAYEAPASMDNVASKAVFTATQGRLIRGGILVSDPTKGGNNGLVLSCVRFATAKPVDPGQRIEVIAGITYVPLDSIGG